METAFQFLFHQHIGTTSICVTKELGELTFDKMMTNQSKYIKAKAITKNVNDNENMRFTEIMTQDSHHNSCINAVSYTHLTLPTTPYV